MNRERLPPFDLLSQERAVILLSMAMMDDVDMRNASHEYGQDIEDVRGELADPARWSAPGWYWLSALKPGDLLGLAQAAGRIGQIGGAVAYLRVASLIGSSEDVAELANLLVGPFSNFPKLAEDTISCITSLATEQNLPLLQRMAKHDWPIVRRAAAKAIGKVGTKDDLAILGELAKDVYPRPGAGGDVRVREAAVEAIRDLGYVEGFQVLRGMVHDKAFETQVAVAEAIAKLGDEGAMSLLAGKEFRSHMAARGAAARAYAQLSCRGDLAVLRGATESGMTLMQEGVAWILKDRGGQEDLPLLRGLMASGSRTFSTPRSLQSASLAMLRIFPY